MLVPVAASAVLAGSAAAATPSADIAGAGKLEHITIGNELSCQVKYQGESAFQFYPSSVSPGDCGTFLSLGLGNELFTPDFANHGATATGIGGLDNVTGVFAPVSQSPVSGAGTTASPLTVTTVVDVPGRNLRLTETDSYVSTSQAYQTDVTIQNTGTAAREGNLYRAADCFLQGSDTGFGMLEGSNPGCALSANNSPAGRIEQWVAITPGNRYSEGPFGTGSTGTGIWHQISLRAPLNNAVEAATDQDNGAGISWAFSVGGGASQTFSHYTVLSPTGVSGAPEFTPPQSSVTRATCSNNGSAVVVSDAGSGAAAIHYRLDGGAEQVLATTGNPGSATIPVTGDAVHSLEYWGEDRGGNLEAPHNTVSVIVDHGAPVVTLARRPRTTFFVGEAATVGVTASDAISGLAVNPAPAVRLQTSRAGTFTVSAVARDNCGNQTVVPFNYKVTNAATKLGLPSSKACVSRRHFRIRIRQIKGFTYRSAKVSVPRRPSITREGRKIGAPVDLRGLPRGTFTVKIVVTTTTGTKIVGKRTYHTCAKKRKNKRL
jgi:hypothetical protein